METPVQDDTKVLGRRGFLVGIIAACAAPAIVRSGLIMPIKPALIIPEYKWTSLGAGITITEEILNESFYEVFGRDQFGMPQVDRVPTKPDILLIERKYFQTIEKVVLQVSGYNSPLPQTYHSVEQTESQDESAD